MDKHFKEGLHIICVVICGFSVLAIFKIFCDAIGADLWFKIFSVAGLLAVILDKE